MSTVPDGKNDKISYYETHAPTWVTNAAVLNVEPALAAQLQTMTTAARTSYNAQLNAQTAARNAVGNCNLAIDSMARVGGEIIKQIRATAAVSGDSIYTTAGLPIPPIPGPTPQPGTPTDFKVALLPNGSLNLSWKCANPGNASGPVYHVYRRLDPTAEWAFVVGSGTRRAVDATVPAGVPRVYYSVQAVRTTGIGQAAEFVVNFGVNAGGTMTASVAAAPTTPKLAA